METPRFRRHFMHTSRRSMISRTEAGIRNQAFAILRNNDRYSSSLPFLFCYGRSISIRFSIIQGLRSWCFRCSSDPSSECSPVGQTCSPNKSFEGTLPPRFAFCSSAFGAKQAVYLQYVYKKHPKHTAEIGLSFGVVDLVIFVASATGRSLHLMLQAIRNRRSQYRCCIDFSCFGFCELGFEISYTCLKAYHRGCQSRVIFFSFGIVRRF